LQSISFGTIENSDLVLQKASGTVSVNSGQVIKLSVVAEPWYYSTDDIKLLWTSSNVKAATVDQEGNVTINDLEKRAYTTITATVLDENGDTTLYSATVRLYVQTPFVVSNNTLTHYYGWGGVDGVVTIPNDQNITKIGEEAFKDNTTVKTIIIPKTVTQINERAFLNCTSLEKVCFISEDKQDVADASLNLILRNAFKGCVNLTTFDLTNAKVITLAQTVFDGCTSLKEIIRMDKIGTAGDKAFAGTALEEADLSGLHTVGEAVFQDCVNLKTITTAKYTAIGKNMFKGCTALGKDGAITVSTANIGEGAFTGCTSLTAVNFGYDSSANGTDTVAFTIAAKAFENCTSLATVNFNGYNVSYIGDNAFKNCTSLTNITLDNGTTTFGQNVFDGTSVTINIGTNNSGNYFKDSYGALYLQGEGSKVLVIAPATIDASFTIMEGTTAIGAYAFSGSTLSGVTTIAIPSTVTSIGEGAFAGLNISTITLPAELTAIEDYTFYQSSLTAITIPAKVKTIGVQAFANCTSLATITFEDNSALNETGDYAFAGTAITGIVMPDGVATMGSGTFENCTSLTTVTLPSVTSMGSYTFLNCYNLQTATYGANATVTGDYTFVGIVIVGEAILGYQSSLTEVTLSDNMKEIGEGVFEYAIRLTSIDLKNVTVLGDGAFFNCSSLATVTGLDKVKTIGASALRNCALTALNLDSAETIGVLAFAAYDGSTISAASYTSINMPKVKTIGSMAFLGGSEATVTLPATLQEVGDGAFAGSTKLTAITVDAGNTLFFADEGVLYRYMQNSTNNTEYELCAYPSAKPAPTYSDGTTTSQKTYKIKDGTISIQPYAFAYLKNYSGELTSRNLTKVILPYSLLTLGDGAFLSSGINEFVFECITAPTLLSTYKYIALTYTDGTYYMTQYTMYYDNFGSLLYNSYGSLTQGEYTIYYPSNGSGYDNYVYNYFFNDKITLGELMNNYTRSLKERITNFADADTVSGWLNLEKNAENTAMVQAFADSVKQAHADYLELTSDKQVEYLGTANVEKLSAIETALKDVKTYFGIARKATSLVINENSTHKTTYKPGEKFSLKGLSITVVYDDYTEELADMSKISISTFDDRALTIYDTDIGITGYGLTAYVPITVSNDTSSSNNNTSNGNSGKASGCGSVTTGGFDGGMMIMTIGICALAIAVKTIVARRKKED
jgi:hypothetical protein